MFFWWVFLEKEHSRALKRETEEQNCCGGEKICPHKCHYYWSPLLESHTELSTLTVSDIHAISFYWHQHLGGAVAESHAGASRKAELEKHVGEFTQSLPQSENQIHSARVCSIPSDQASQAVMSWDHSVHLCFFSSRNTHQALPSALFRAAHALLLSHWSSHSFGL